ncbi:MAG TPA: hypothetical protein VJZ26_18410, partial [Blastocatellia bacterium]|nr:hypothetical protein [Blastocatellia bacterium]
FARARPGQLSFEPVTLTPLFARSRADLRFKSNALPDSPLCCYTYSLEFHPQISDLRFAEK